MAVSYRPLRRRDFGDCFNSLATHPILASRYGHNIRFFRPALVEVSGSDSFVAVVFEEIGLPRRNSLARVWEGLSRTNSSWN